MTFCHVTSILYILTLPDQNHDTSQFIVTHSRGNWYLLCCAALDGEIGYTQHLSEGSKLCDEWYHMQPYLELKSLLQIALHKQAVTHAQTLIDIQIILVFFCISIFLAFHLIYIYIYIYIQNHHYIKCKQTLKIIF